MHPIRRTPIYTYLRVLSLLYVINGTLVGLLFLTIPFIGIIFFILCLMIAFHTKGLQISTENMTYRFYNSYWGIKIGSWKTKMNLQVFHRKQHRDRRVGACIAL